MKFLWLSLLVFMVPLFSMEQEQPFLCNDLTFIIQNFIFLKNKKLFFFDKKDCCLSSNYAEFDEHCVKNGRTLTNIELSHDGPTSQPIFLCGESSLSQLTDMALELKNVQEVQFFDGPNEKNVIATDRGCYIFNVLKQSENQELGNSKKSKKRSCWCTDCMNLFRTIQTYFIEYPIDYAQHICSVALCKKKDRIAVSYDNNSEHKVVLYDFNEFYEMSSIAELKVPLSSLVGKFKKLAFLTDRTLLALTNQGKLFSLVLDKNKKLSMHPQTILDSQNQAIMVKDFAVDHHNPTQMLMSLANHTLILGDLVHCTYTPLLHKIDIDLLKFYNDSIAYKERDKDQLIISELLFVRRYMLAQLIAHYYEQKNSSANT